MVVCKYYIEGRCYFGANCRYEHSYPGDPRSKSAYTYTAPARTPQQSSQTPRNVTEARQVMLDEIRSIEAGKQWLFSCFSPLKDEHVVPNMDDISPEELRFEAYQAQSQNTFDNYKRKVEALQQEYQTKRSQLLNLDVGTFMEVFVSKPLSAITSTPTTSNPFSKATGFGQNSTAVTQPSGSLFQPDSGTSNFGQSTFGAQPTFANKPNVSSIFGQSTTPSQSFAPNKTPPPSYSQSTFGQFGQSSNIFGQSAAPTTSNSSLFSQQPSSSVFGGTSQSIFGGGQSFASPQTQNQQSVFGQSQQTFGSSFSQPTNAFSSSLGQAPVNIFSTQPASPSAGNMFAQAGSVSTPGTNLFGQPSSASANAFTPQPTSTSGNLFTPQPTSTPGNVFGTQPTATLGNVFGTPTSTPVNIFGTPTTTPSGVFSTQPTVTPSNVFGTPTSTPSNLFTGQPTSNAPSNVFGTPTSTPSNLFTGQPTSNAPSNVFGTPTSTPSNVFGTPTSTPSNVFTSQPTSTPGNVFGTATSTPSNVFTSQPTSTPGNVFGQQAASTPTAFNQAASVATPGTTNIFTQAAVASASTAFAPSSILAQASPPQSGNSFSSSPQQANVNPFTQAAAVSIQQNHYSKLEELSADEKSAYEGQAFELGKIPIKPPPRELCT